MARIQRSWLLAARHSRCSPAGRPPAFRQGSLRRTVLAQRLQRVYNAIRQTGCLARFIIFGSFVTAKAEPGDIDIFLLTDDSFDVGRVTGEAAILFDHMAAYNYVGASIFWLRRLAALDGEQAALKGLAGETRRNTARHCRNH